MLDSCIIKWHPFDVSCPTCSCAFGNYQGAVQSRALAMARDQAICLSRSLLRPPNCQNTYKQTGIHHHSSSFIIIHHHSSSFIIIHHHSSSFIIIHHHSSSFIIIHHHSSSFIIIHHHSSPFIIIHHHSSSFIIIHHHSSSFIIIHHHSSSFIIIHHHSSSFIIIHHHSSSFINIHHTKSGWTTKQYKTMQNVCLKLLNKLKTALPIWIDQLPSKSSQLGMPHIGRPKRRAKLPNSFPESGTIHDPVLESLHNMEIEEGFLLNWQC